MGLGMSHDKLPSMSLVSELQPVHASDSQMPNIIPFTLAHVGKAEAIKHIAIQVSQ